MVWRGKKAGDVKGKMKLENVIVNGTDFFLRYESGHQPLPSPDLAPRVAVMFRNPIDRIISGYNLHVVD